MTTLLDRMRPVHPGEVLLEDCLKPLGMSVEDFAAQLHLPLEHVRGIIDERRAVDAMTALRLSRFFGEGAQFWLDLQTSYDLKSVPASILEQIAREIQPRENERENSDFIEVDYANLASGNS